MTHLTKRLTIRDSQLMGVLGLGLVLSLGGLWLQGPATLLRFHRYVRGDFQLSNLPVMGLVVILLPGGLLLPMIRRWATRDVRVGQAWAQVLGVAVLNVAYGVLVLVSLNRLAPLPREFAILLTPLAASMSGGFLEAGGGLCFLLVAIGLSQLWLSRSHPRVAQWGPLSLIPLLPVIAGFSTRLHSHLGPITAVVTAVAPFVLVLIPGSLFGLIVSYVNRAAQRDLLKKLVVASAQQKTAASRRM